MTATVTAFTAFTAAVVTAAALVFTVLTGFTAFTALTVYGAAVVFTGVTSA
jgi:hypothetical protein